MIPELSIIKLFLSYTHWQAFNGMLSVNDLPREIQGVARTLYAYHNERPDTVLSVADLANLFFASSPPNREFMVGVFDTLDKLEVREDTVGSLIQGIRSANIMREISLASYDVAEGKGSINAVKDLFDSLNVVESEAVGEEVDFVTSDLELLVNNAIRTPGLRWRLSTLNRMLGSLRQGDFGFLFARPETGKTTFLASEVTFMAEQANKSILWFNNEEQSEKVMLRCIQAALGIDMTTLFRDLKGNRDKYMELTGERIKIPKASTAISASFVEKACAKYQPALIIFDQIDKIVGFSNDREDLRLGSIYQWARELAKCYAPTIGVCQADGSGEGVKWLTMGNVANAKTSKQAEADWILGIGKVNDNGYDNLRFLHASKNKLMGDEDTVADLRHGKQEVLIEPNIARYRDIS